MCASERAQKLGQAQDILLPKAKEQMEIFHPRVMRQSTQGKQNYFDTCSRKKILQTLLSLCYSENATEYITKTLLLFPSKVSVLTLYDSKATVPATRKITVT